METSLENVRDTADLRIAVAFLGEKSQYAWWGTSFLNEMGWRYLERLFPRTSTLASVESAVEGAKIAHDERIGKGKVAHLFRFAPETEQRLHAILRDTPPDHIRAICASKQSGLDILTGFAGKAAKVAPGPIQIGPLDAVFRRESITKMAAAYLVAFQTGQPVFPYFS